MAFHPKPKHKTPRDIVESILEAIFEVHEQRKRLDELSSFCADRYSGNYPKTDEFYRRLHEKENVLWRDLCAWGLALPSKKDRERIQLAVHKRFNASSAYDLPSWWKGTVEEFHGTAFETFCPNEVKAQITAAQRLAIVQGVLNEATGEG